MVKAILPSDAVVGDVPSISSGRVSPGYPFRGHLANLPRSFEHVAVEHLLSIRLLAAVA